jgi:hypothetical protein
MPAAAPLRLVPRPSRASVIIDATGGPPRMTPPLSHAELRAMLDGSPAVPHAVFCGMWVASWAAAEGCGLILVSGRLEPSCRYEPSDDLWVAVGREMHALVGCLGFGIPIVLDQHHRARGATWPGTWGGN